MLFHEVDSFDERGVGCDGDNLRCHHFLDAAAMRKNILIGKLAGAAQKIEQPEPVAFSVQFPAAKEIAFTDNADKVAAGIDNGETADATIEHNPCRVHDRRFRADGDGRCVHDRLNKHARLLL